MQAPRGEAELMASTDPGQSIDSRRVESPIRSDCLSDGEHVYRVCVRGVPEHPGVPQSTTRHQILVKYNMNFTR